MRRILPRTTQTTRTFTMISSPSSYSCWFVLPKALYGKSNFYLAYAILIFLRNALTGAVIGRVRGRIFYSTIVCGEEVNYETD